jgi:hypothetical protein
MASTLRNHKLVELFNRFSARETYAPFCGLIKVKGLPRAEFTHRFGRSLALSLIESAFENPEIGRNDNANENEKSDPQQETRTSEESERSEAAHRLELWLHAVDLYAAEAELTIASPASSHRKFGMPGQ